MSYGPLHGDKMWTVHCMYRGFNKHRWFCQLLCSKKSATFFRKKEASSLINVVNKKCIKKSEWKCTMMCFHKGPLVLHLMLRSSIWSPECWNSHIRALKFQNFLGKHMPPDTLPLQKKGTKSPLLIFTLFKPADLFNFYWNLGM